MLAHGHPEAWSYPIWLLWFETGLVVDRLNAEHATQAMLFQMAMGTLPNMAANHKNTAANQRAFAKQMKALIGET